MIPEALQNILDSNNYTFQEILFRLPEKQKQLLIAINKEGEARAVTSGEFVRRNSLPSPRLRTGRPQRIARERLYYARTGRLPHLRPILRNLARRELLTGSPDNPPWRNTTETVSESFPFQGKDFLCFRRRSCGVRETFIL